MQAMPNKYCGLVPHLLNSSHVMTVHGQCGEEGTNTAAPTSFSEHVGMYSIRTDF